MKQLGVDVKKDHAIPTSKGLGHRCPVASHSLDNAKYLVKLAPLELYSLYIHTRVTLSMLYTESTIQRFQCTEAAFGRCREDGKLTSFDTFYNVDASSRPALEFRFGTSQEIRISFRLNTLDRDYQMISINLYLSEICGALKLFQGLQATDLVLRSKGAFRVLRRVMTTEARSLPDEQDFGRLSPWQWFRCNEITKTGLEEDATSGPIELYHEKALFEVGRCNSIRVRLDLTEEQSSRFSQSMQTLLENNMQCVSCSPLDLTMRVIRPEVYKSIWRRYYKTTTTLSFAAMYLLEAAVSLGRIEEIDLMKVVSTLSSINPPTATENILKQLVHGDGLLLDPIDSIKKMYARKGWLSIMTEQLPEYCVLLHKVVITSTSMIVLPPSMEMSNRILRQYATHLDRFLRIQFLEDIKRGRLHGGSSDIMQSLFKRVMRTMVNGVIVGGRHYRFLAFGNSQLREHGVFFYSDCRGVKDCGNASCNGLTATTIRKDIGDVSKILIVAKQTARVGQAFSTTRALSNRSENHNIVVIPDVIGGLQNKYNFTDGVGMITSDLMSAVSKDMGSVGLSPSAFQFRLGGAKGVLALVSPDGLLGKYKKAVVRAQQVFLRGSQTKFSSDHDSLEVVRLANYGSAFLNRQFITTLWTLGVETSVFLNLQKLMIQELDACMLDEEVALKCLRKYVDESGASTVLGDLVTFGFLRRGNTFVNHVLRLFRTWSLKQLKEKAKISVEKGCFLMGVADEIGVLRGHHESMYGQDETDLDKMDLPEIFVQISDPQNSSRLKVIEGICVIGRAPALHPGDLRVVRAVDKHELRHLHNVLVFPTQGDQDVASMCSGGDLDGDDYTVIWEPSLIPPAGHRYERCMSYEGPKPRLMTKILLRDVFEFVIDFMKNDSLGQIALSHLAFAHDPKATLRTRTDVMDCRAFSDECIELADLHSTAVDFVKTGVPASMPRHLFRTSYPDFMEVKNKDSFVSDTALSHLYRQVRISTSTFEPIITYDRTLCNVPNMLEYIDAAREMKQSYDQSLRRLMAEYGIQTEAEVVTGFILGFDARFSGQREYSMRTDVGQKFEAIKHSIKQQILKISATDEHGRHVDKHLEARTRESFVAAMYDVTFADMMQLKDPKTAMVSFPWVEHEVLGRLSSRYG